MPSRERWTGVAVLLLVALVGVAVLYVLDDARRSGIDALEESKLNEVRASARSFNQRQLNQLTSSGGIAGQGFQLTVGSASDQQVLEGLLTLVPDPRTGFFLVNADGLITAGVLLEDPAVVGSTYDRPGYRELVAGARFRQGVGGILPVGDGLTTTAPTTALVFPVLDPSTGDVRGSFVFEADVIAESDFNVEIASLAVAGTDRWRFLDSRGTVVASTDLSEVAAPAADRRLLELAEGVHHLDDRIVVIQEVPASGWRLVFDQELQEFQSSLADPLQDAGAIVVLLLLLSGAAVVVMLVRQLRAAREEERRLRALSESQHEVIDIVSRELRTPVAGVLGFLETTLEHWGSMPDDERRHAVARAATNARRLQALTRDVLAAEQVEDPADVMDFEPVDVREVVAAAVEGANVAWPDRVIDVAVEGVPPTVHADPARLQHVVSHLLDNAHKHSPAGRPVEVVVRAGDGEVVVEVCDHGPALDPQSVDRIFDKFIRGRGGTVTGTGLGLYISRRVVEAHGGRIWARSGDDQGATFGFSVPAEASSPRTPAEQE